MALVRHESFQPQGNVPSTTPMGVLSVAAHGWFNLGISSASSCVDLFLTPMRMTQEHGRVRKGACGSPWGSVMDPAEH